MVSDGSVRSINLRRRSQHHALVTIIHNREIYFDSNIIQEGKSTLLQCFPNNCFAKDVARSMFTYDVIKSAICTHYVDDVNYCSLITVTFPGEYYLQTKSCRPVGRGLDCSEPKEYYLQTIYLADQVLSIPKSNIFIMVS